MSNPISEKKTYSVLQGCKVQFLLYLIFSQLLWCRPVIIAWIILVLSHIDVTNMGGLRLEIIVRDLTSHIKYTDVHTPLHTERKICDRNIIVITNFLL